MTINTRDLGLAIRDHLEQKDVCHFNESEGDLIEQDGSAEEVVFVDVSDPNNLVVHMQSEETFVVRIFRAGRP